MHHSVMEHIEKWLKHIINHIEDFIRYGVKLSIILDLFICIGIGILDLVYQKSKKKWMII